MWSQLSCVSCCWQLPVGSGCWPAVCSDHSQLAGHLRPALAAAVVAVVAAANTAAVCVVAVEPPAAVLAVVVVAAALAAVVAAAQAAAVVALAVVVAVVAVDELPSGKSQTACVTRCMTMWLLNCKMKIMYFTDFSDHEL